LKDAPSVPGDWVARLRHVDASAATDVAVSLLSEGEISAAELLKLAFDGVVLHPGETSREYAPELDRSAAQAPIRYLLAIAERSIDGKRAAEARRRLGEAGNLSGPEADDKAREAVDFILATNKWTADKARLLEQGKGLSAAGGLSVLEDIERRVRKLAIPIDPQVQQGMSRAIEFLKARRQADSTMGNVAVALASTPSLHWVALIAGASHTEGLRDLFRRANLPSVVLTPLALRDRDRIGDLTDEQMERKYRFQFVTRGPLTAWVEKVVPAQKKPQPILATERGRAQFEIRAFVDDVARRILSDGVNPFDLTPGDLRGDFVSIDPGRVEVVQDARANGGNRVVFPLEVRTHGQQAPYVIWVSAARSDTDGAAAQDSSLEEKLKTALGDLKGPTSPSDSGIAMTSRTTARFGQSRDAL
jgi:hypothetical protein